MPRKIQLRKRDKKKSSAARTSTSSNRTTSKDNFVTCEKCGKKFRSRGLGPHMKFCEGKRVDGENKTPVPCEKCGKYFKPRGLGPHMKFCEGVGSSSSRLGKRSRKRSSSVTSKKRKKKKKKPVVVVEESSSEEEESSSEEEEEEEQEQEQLPDLLVRVRSRKRWKTSVPELVGLCNEAVRRRTLQKKPGARTFKAPISIRFVEDTIELMQPLFGWMLHESVSGDLKGFLLCTTFTTWVGAQNLRWLERKHRNLARRLNDTPRQGTPLTTGVVWPRIAEVSLVGGLGCGSALMHELLCRLKSGSIVNSIDRKPYEYVALQATKNAILFYERLGFIHVEAEARHFTKIIDGRVISNSLGPWIKFRHFEYVVPPGLEPSYMMILPLSKYKMHARISNNWNVVGEGGSIDAELRESKKKKKRRSRSKKKDVLSRPFWFDRHLRAVCGENARLSPEVYRSNGSLPDTGENKRRGRNGSSITEESKVVHPVAASSSSSSSTRRRDDLKMMPKSHRDMIARGELLRCEKCGDVFHPRLFGRHRAHCKGMSMNRNNTRVLVTCGQTRSGRSFADGDESGSDLMNGGRNKEWTCSRCTLINKASKFSCAVCGFKRLRSSL